MISDNFHRSPDAREVYVTCFFHWCCIYEKEIFSYFPVAFSPCPCPSNLYFAAAACRVGSHDCRPLVWFRNHEQSASSRSQCFISGLELIVMAMPIFRITQFKHPGASVRIPPCYVPEHCSFCPAHSFVEGAWMDQIPSSSNFHSKAYSIMGNMKYEEAWKCETAGEHPQHH